MTTYSATEVFGSDLLRDERILWSGQPDPSILLSKADIFIIPLSVLWAGFAFVVSGVLVALVIRGETVALVGGIIAWPMGLMGLYILFGRFLYNRWVRRRTHYAVTDLRVLALTNALARDLATAYLTDIPAVSKSVRADGTGSLWFGNAPWWVVILGSHAMDTFMSPAGVPVAFYDVPRVDEVHELANRVRAGDYRR